MTLALDSREIRALLLDIEGTTTPIDFVYQVLFPFARAHVKEFLARQRSSDELRADVSGLREEYARDRSAKLDPPSLPEESMKVVGEPLVAYVHWLMEHDRKSTPLKSLQGKIWEEGYRTGELRGQVFTDVPPALGRWRQQGKTVSLFSSGSVLAQKLLFAHTTAGDLTPLIHAYFDTTTGPKSESGSYQLIAAALKLRQAEVLFISDVVAELDAAHTAGMRTLLSVRPGNRAPPPGHTHPAIDTFEEVFP